MHKVNLVNGLSFWEEESYDPNDYEPAKEGEVRFIDGKVYVKKEKKQEEEYTFYLDMVLHGEVAKYLMDKSESSPFLDMTEYVKSLLSFGIFLSKHT